MAREILKVKGMAERLQLKESFLYNLTRRKDIKFPVIRVGKYLRFDPER